ncbi:MAG: BMP family protein [Sphaerochaeta sp.]|jgi:basic membrane protein A|nr:BMP family protein [Sphaerochaeta sp.]MCI2097645.1 BMP family protein [Sphaerochaeta sp.]MCI2129234.1 BMP family protein [Sphaerochaeta sp.]
MKKITSIVMVLVMAAALFAQGGQEKAAPAQAAGSDKPTIRLMTDATGIDDKSFNAAAWRGIVAFYGDTVANPKGRGTYYDVVTAQSQDMYIPNLQQAADEGYSLICATGFTFADAVQEVANKNPNQKFMIVDVNWLSGDNIMQFIYKEEEGSYLVGKVAALQAKADGITDPKFGFIGGVPGATITKFEMGYIQGIRSVFPNATVFDYYANDWGKPELAKAQAKNWYDNGVYCIFSAAGGTGNGTIAQAKEYRLAGKNVWAIGVDSDQYEDGIYEGKKSAVLTSMVKRVENSTKMALEAVADGTFKGGVVTMGMKEDGVDYSKANPELSADVQAAVDASKADIISGKIKIYGTYKDALAAGAVPAGLAAKDD